MKESAMPQTALFRARQGKVIAGVCAGVAARFGWDPIVVRLALVALVLCGFGSGILAYLAAWIVMPKAPLIYGYVPPSAPMGPAEAVV
jgi:phage shock protein C